MCSVSRSFSILERIDVGETAEPQTKKGKGKKTFSILERIDVGETCKLPRR